MIEDVDVVQTILAILFLVIPSIALGKLCARFGISEIIGFVIVGVILGPFALGGIVPYFDKPLVQLDEITLAIWEISGIIILFSAGLLFTFKDLRNAGYRAIIVGIMGVASPLALGYLVSIAFGFDWTASVIIGATLSATSIAISVTLLQELGRVKTKEGNILVNAAVIDDVLVLAVLSVVVSIVVSSSLPSIESILAITGQSLIFWLLLLLSAVYLLPKIVHRVAIAESHSSGMKGVKRATALGSAFGFAAIAGSIGLNPILGAFASGMGLAGTKLAVQVRVFVARLRAIAAPMFFAIVGAHVDLRHIDQVDVIFVLIILAVAILSKLIGCGVPAALLLKNRIQGMRIGCGMIARGEIAFIIAGAGLSHGMLTGSVYTTLVLVILVTIIITPVLMKSTYKK